jgi:hypothetical protein
MCISGRGGICLARSGEGSRTEGLCDIWGCVFLNIWLVMSVTNGQIFWPTGVLLLVENMES